MSEYTKPWDEVSEQEKTELLKDFQLSGYDPDIPATIFKQKQLTFYPSYSRVKARRIRGHYDPFSPNGRSQSAYCEIV